MEDRTTPLLVYPYTLKKVSDRKGSAVVFIREKKTDCANYREVDIIPRTEAAEQAARGKRGKKRKVNAPKQKDLNDKNAKRYLVQLGNGNFHIGDLHTSCTYDAENLPETVEEAEKIVTNYLRRIAYRRNKLGLEPLKYILVTEYKYSKDGQCLKRIHHHIIMNGGLDRDDVELMWTKDRINWKKTKDPEYRASIKQMGWVNADRLQMNENGIEGLCKYIVKDPQGKKRYSSSRNLDRPETTREDGGEKQQRDQNHWKYSRNLNAPEEKCNDFKYSKRKVEQLAKSPDAGQEEFRKIYSNYNIVSYIDFDTALAVCRRKGEGWHLNQNGVFAAINLWCMKNGFTPRGNTNWDRSYEKGYEKGINTYIDGSHGGGRTATGSGPVTWNHDGSPAGIADLCGNCWEWVSGLRCVDGEIQIIPYGNAMKSDCNMGSNSTEWKAIKPDGTLVAPGTVGTLKIDRTSASDATLRINTSVTTQTTDSNDTSQPFKDVKEASGVSIPQILIAAGLFPDSAQTTPGRFWARNNGERLPIRGSSFGITSLGGAGALSLDNPRSNVRNNVSFRSAFVE